MPLASHGLARWGLGIPIRKTASSDLKYHCRYSLSWLRIREQTLSERFIDTAMSCQCCDADAGASLGKPWLIG